MITIYDYEWADDNDYGIWAPFEAAVLTIDEQTFHTVCRGDVHQAVEEGHTEHTGGYAVARPSEIPSDVYVYGNATEVTQSMTQAILGCPYTLADWAGERRITIDEARTILTPKDN